VGLEPRHPEDEIESIIHVQHCEVFDGIEIVEDDAKIDFNSIDLSHDARGESNRDLTEISGTSLCKQSAVFSNTLLASIIARRTAVY
jgi:hypothetical protein